MVGVSADSNQARQAGMLDATSPQLRTEVDKREVLRIGREGGKHGVWCVCFINKWSKGLPTAKSATCLSRSRAKASARAPSSNTSISNCCSFPKRTPSSSQSPTSATLSNKSKPRVGPSSSKRIQCSASQLPYLRRLLRENNNPSRCPNLGRLKVKRALFQATAAIRGGNPISRRGLRHLRARRGRKSQHRKARINGSHRTKNQKEASDLRAAVTELEKDEKGYWEEINDFERKLFNIE